MNESYHFQVNLGIEFESKAALQQTGKLVNVLVAVDEEYRYV
jgi:hypothetical protein